MTHNSTVVDTPVAAATRLVRDAVKRAQRQHVVQENFIVDFGDEAVQETGLRDLGRHNVVQRDTKIARLWVMTRGQFTAVELEATVDTTREAIPRVAEVPPSFPA